MSKRKEPEGREELGKEEKKVKSEGGVEEALTVQADSREQDTSDYSVTIPSTRIDDKFRARIDSQFTKSVYDSSKPFPGEFRTESVPRPTVFDLRAEKKHPKMLVDFADEAVLRFADAVIKSSDHKTLFFYRVLLMSSDLDVLKTSLDLSSEIIAAKTEISMDAPAWAINVALNALIGKSVDDWDFLIGAIRVLLRYGSTETAPALIATIEKKELPWPISRLETVFAEAHLGVQKLAEWWSRAPAIMDSTSPLKFSSFGADDKGGFIGKLPSKQFWLGCEKVMLRSPVRDISFILPFHNATEGFLAKLVIEALDKRHTRDSREKISRALKFVLKEFPNAPAVNRFTRNLACAAIDKGE